MSLLFPKEPLLTGGAGRAKGLGGPVAPALSNALALGEGGGRTTPEAFPGSPFTGAGCGAPAVVSFEDEFAVSSPPSDCSLGICTFSRGRLASVCMLFVRLGGLMPGIDGTEFVRFTCDGCGGNWAWCGG